VSTIGLTGSAARCGAHCWVERRSFEVLGAWAPAAGDPEATVLLDRHSLHAAWRAEQWWDRLPVLAGVERDGLVGPPPGWEALLGGAGAPPPELQGVGLVAFAYRVVLARVVAAYRAHEARCAAPADGPVLRTLRLAGDDARRDWEEGEALVQARLSGEAEVAAAAAAVRRGEELLACG
jgi:hypothetical protein